LATECYCACAMLFRPELGVLLGLFFSALSVYCLVFLSSGALCHPRTAYVWCICFY
jgi:hypothetical protein